MTIRRTATISADGKFRYSLSREKFDDGVGLPNRAVYVGVNPSTADALVDDNTIRVLYGFSKRFGVGSFTVVNKFAYRATAVADLKGVVDPVGPDNDSYIRAACSDTDFVVFIWGALGKLSAEHRTRWVEVDAIVRSLGKQPMCIGTTSGGHPRHVLMQSFSLPLVPWDRP